MKIRAIKLKMATTDGNYGFRFEFGRGLTVIRGNNSSGKSTLLNCLMYSLGMEELVGGRGEKGLNSALKDHFVYKDNRVNVLSSEVFVELEGVGGNIVTLRRAIRDEVRSNKLIEVFDGAHLTTATEKLGAPKPTYLFDAGSAKKEEGFHQFLETFMGYRLPGVPTTSGGMTKLYLQTVFAALSVEQKRGWTDYIANMPFFGIRDGRTRVTEFLLGLSVFERQAVRAELDAESLAIDMDWRRAFDTLKQAAASNGLVIVGLSATATAELDATAVRFVKSNGRAETAFGDHLKVLRAEYAELAKKIEAYGGASGTAALQELDKASAELQELSVIHERASANLSLQKASLGELQTLLDEANADLDRNKTARKLRELGAQMEVQVAGDHCPTCHQSVDDTLLFGLVTGPQMDLNTNIEYLEAQRRMLQRQMNGSQEEIRQSEILVTDLSMRLAAKHDYRNSLRGDVSTGVSESRALVRRQIQIELELSSLSAFETQAEGIVADLLAVSKRLAANQLQRRALPKDVYSAADMDRIELFEKWFRSNASSFGYESADIKDIRISTDTLTPTLAEMELREIRDRATLAADSSASDFVRLIWSYLLALYQTSATRGFEGNHPGLLVLDEPGQHSMSSMSQHALLQLLSGESGLQAIVAASFDQNESVFLEATAGLDFKLIRWEGKVIQPLIQA